MVYIIYIYTNIWLIDMVNVGKYTIHGSYGVSGGWTNPFEQYAQSSNEMISSTKKHPQEFAEQDGTVIGSAEDGRKDNLMTRS